MMMCLLFLLFFQPEEKVVEEAKGRIRYRLEYDFTTQELKITVSKQGEQELNWRMPLLLLWCFFSPLRVFSFLFKALCLRGNGSW